jgi:methyl-accepting chemotaxis protein-1 (serine sensor receptor)
MTGLTIKARLYLNLAVLATALVLVCGVGLSAFDEAEARLKQLYSDGLISISQVDEIYQRSLQSQQLRLEAYVHQDPAYTKQNYEGVKSNRARINELMEQFDEAQLPEAARALSDEIKAQRASIVNAGKQEIDLLLAGDYEGAKNVRLQSIEPVIDRMDATSEKLAEERRGAAERLIEESEAALASDRRLMLASFAIALALAMWFAWLLARHITGGLGQAENLARRVARGQLGNHVEVNGRDEIAVLLRTLKDMDEKLLQTVRAVSVSAGEVDRASRQLSQGADELSERTQAQAAALEETAASMEEMAATVKQNSDNSMQANQIAVGTRGQADQGGAVVQRAIAAMEEITQASRRIEDIIGVIDEIAFQTNLLALNAAVEAARAGEQGRGFAVVAGEVRNLAQRSASAAKEIKTLIGDSVGKVQAGSTLVGESGKTLAEIVTGVKKVTDIVAEMAAATEEQSSGIEQINHAISNMDSATQQNAALVEESTAAAKSMQQQASRLQELVSFFRFEGAAAASSVERNYAAKAIHEASTVRKAA